MKQSMVMALVGMVLAVIAACGGSPASQVGRSPTPSPGSWISVDEAARSVSLTLIAHYSPVNSGFNFNGYERGRMVVTVPDGWKVTVECRNNGPVNHACTIANGPGDTVPAFPGATSPDPVTGMQGGQSNTFTFTATPVGTYRITCPVAGHDQGGMWDTLRVVAAGLPSIS